MIQANYPGASQPGDFLLRAAGLPRSQRYRISYRLIVSLGLLLLTSCSHPAGNCVVLPYKDFGPQVLAWEHIGKEWWQWQAHGDSDPGKTYDVKVVVYRNIPLQEVQNNFPVIPVKQQDFRFIESDDALDYLQTMSAENIMPEVSKQLQTTKDKILAELTRQDKNPTARSNCVQLP